MIHISDLTSFLIWIARDRPWSPKCANRMRLCKEPKQSLERKLKRSCSLISKDIKRRTNLSRVDRDRLRIRIVPMFILGYLVISQHQGTL
ncbi:hypothetical protein C8J56DRAFT_1162428 [Mycena floridula]|nr:hypothetical protein C8J56DRAFT_1162428 [Mycena floridula]